MSQSIRIFWDPQGFELDELGSKQRAGDPADGDTPYIRLSIRMLGIDTPETNLPGHSNPVQNNAKLQEVATWLQTEPHGLPAGLVNYLVPRLQTGQAGVLHQRQGEDAKGFFKRLLDEKLARPNKPERNFFVWTSRQPFDQNKRLLAYLAPNFTDSEKNTPEYRQRKTFNLLMLESGWAAPIIIYPNLFKNSDLRLARQAIAAAITERKGIWADEPLTLLAYEFRACLRLWEEIQKQKAARAQNRPWFVRTSDWLTRYCADLCAQTIYEPQEYYRVPNENRFFIWPEDVRQAVAELNLTAPADEP